MKIFYFLMLWLVVPPTLVYLVVFAIRMVRLVQFVRYWHKYSDIQL